MLLKHKLLAKKKAGEKPELLCVYDNCCREGDNMFGYFYEHEILAIDQATGTLEKLHHFANSNEQKGMNANGSFALEDMKHDEKYVVELTDEGKYSTCVWREATELDLKSLSPVA